MQTLALVFYHLTSPILFLAAFPIAFFHPKLRSYLFLWLKSPGPKKGGGGSFPILVHAPSGELEYGLPLIYLFEQRKIPFVISYTSPSSPSLYSFQKKNWLAYPLPWDWIVFQWFFLKRIQPRCLVLVRGDFYPGLLSAASWLDIPVVVLAFQQKKDWRELNGSQKWILNHLLRVSNTIFCVQEMDRVRLLEGCSMDIQKKIWVIGDPRLDRIFQRLESKKSLHLPPVTRRRLILGSLWAADEKIWQQVLKRSHLRSWQVVWVPHEPTPEALSRMEHWAQELGCSVVRFSLASREELVFSDFILVDRLGFLAELYPECDLAFVGGSFAYRVHNVLEPLIGGCPTLVGPRSQNSFEVREFRHLQEDSLPYPWVWVSQNSGEVLQWLTRWSEFLSQKPKVMAQARENFQALLRKRQGATEKVFQFLQSRWASQ